VRDALGGRAGATILTVALPGRADSLALAHATRAAELSVIRTTGTAADAESPATYRPASPEPAAP
jgi:hypothetical protein